jgi:hypothetical protein
VPANFVKPSAAEIREFRLRAPAAIPDAYLAYLQEFGAVQLDVPNIGSGLVCFWPLPEVMGLNEGYGIAKFSPGLFAFGTDGGGQLYVFDLRDPQSVSVGDVPSIPLELREYRLLASSFDEFAEQLSRGSPA